MPSFNCVVTPKTWFDAIFPAILKGELCAPTMEMLLYLRLQNSTQPLQGCVFVGAAEVDVDVLEEVLLLRLAVRKVSVGEAVIIVVPLVVIVTFRSAVIELAVPLAPPVMYVKLSEVCERLMVAEYD